MFDILKKLFSLSHKRIEDLENDDKGWYKGYETFLNWIKEEIEEMQVELKENNTVYLEDELGDVLWCYLCLTHSLHKKAYISDPKKIFERAYKKYDERLEAVWWGKSEQPWFEIKKKQKKELEDEHKEKHGGGENQKKG